jgi:hypothetical protein
MIVSTKVSIGQTPSLIFKAIKDCVLLLQTPQGALYLGGPGVSEATGWLMNSTTTGIELTLTKDDELWGLSGVGEHSIARILVMTK